MNVAHHEGDSFFNAAVSVRAEFRAKAVDPEFAPARGEIRGGEWLNCVNGHSLIIASVRGGACDAELESASGAEVEDSILLGGDSDAVTRGGMEVPILQRSQKLFIELRSHAVQNGFADNFSALVNRDLHHHIAFRIRQFPWINHRIDGSDGQSRTNLIPEHWSAGQSSVRKTCRCAMAKT